MAGCGPRHSAAFRDHTSNDDPPPAYSYARAHSVYVYFVLPATPVGFKEEEENAADDDDDEECTCTRLCLMCEGKSVCVSRKGTALCMKRVVARSA